jgi:hypothetical protein
MAGLKLSLTEKITFALILLILLTAFALFYFDYAFLDFYLEEDGLVEWLTVAGLLAGFCLCVHRFIKLFRIKNWWFLTVNLALGLLLFIAAGEEISWGQRILGIKSSEYFLKHNAQGETNIHNLVVNGVKINKLVFSTILIAVLGIYLVVLPLLYKFNHAVKKYMNNSGVPVPRLYQVISFLLVFAISGLLKHDRNPELLECGAAALFFLIIYNPLNRFIYNKNTIPVSPQ